MIGRVALGAAGVLAAGWGIGTLLANQRPDQVIAAGSWLIGGVIAHDLVLAPLVLAVGWVLVRAVPPWMRASATAGAVILGTVTLVAVPVLGGWGRRADNSSLLARDYWTGWVLVAAIVAIAVVASSLVVRSRERARR